MSSESPGKVINAVLSAGAQKMDCEYPEYARTLKSDWFGEAAAPVLFRAVHHEAWGICRRLLTDRQVSVSKKDLFYIDHYGYSALHYACWWSASAPLDVMRILVDYSGRNFVTLPNRKGRTPLHLAAWRGSDEVVELLVQKCPEAAGLMDGTRKTPLTDACYRNRSKAVLEALIKADLSQIMNKNLHGRTSVALFFRISHGFVSAPRRTRFSEQEEQEEFQAKATVILSSERLVRKMKPLNIDGSLVNLARAAIESPSCPYSYVKHLLDRLDYEEIRDYRDDENNTLLHTAALAEPFEFGSFYSCDLCHKTMNEFNSKQKMYFNRDPLKAHWGGRCSSPACCRSRRPLLIHYVQVPVVSKEDEIAGYLAARCPSLAGTRNARGLLPLELALRSGRTWNSGVRHLVRAHPSGLAEKGRSNGLYPFQAAAAAAARAPIATDPEDDDGERAGLPPPRKRQRTTSGDTPSLPGVGDAGPDDQNNACETAQAQAVTTIYRLLREFPCRIRC